MRILYYDELEEDEEIKYPPSLCLKRTKSFRAPIKLLPVDTSKSSIIYDLYMQGWHNEYIEKLYTYESINIKDEDSIKRFSI